MKKLLKEYPARHAKQKIFEGKKALVMGLGLHGGGVATVRFLASHGARVTATDTRTRESLAPSIAALKGVPVRLVLGEHRAEDFRSHELVVVNPAVPRESKYLAIAKEAAHKEKVWIENDASLFFRFNENPTIAVSGTRGKTTTTLWIAELLKKKYPKVAPSGNTPENALLKEFDRIEGKDIPVVAELSSWQLEYLPQSGRAPHVAVLTNIYPDHLNRYRDMRDYASAKANIFRMQAEGDFLVLNADNAWTDFFLTKRPKSLVFFVSTKVLPRNQSGLFVKKGKLFFRFDGTLQSLFSIERFVRLRGMHNLENLLAAVLAVKLFDPTVAITEKDILKLNTPHMRQEVIAQRGKLTVVNDSCATSPDGTIAAIKRFQKTGNIVLITGGTDKELEFKDEARIIKKYIPIEHCVFLEGSATTKLLDALGKQNNLTTLPTLPECVAYAFTKAKTLKGQTTILFSPGAASFEKFLHEFDRGEQFDSLIKRAIKQIQ